MIVCMRVCRCVSLCVHASVDMRVGAIRGLKRVSGPLCAGVLGSCESADVGAGD